jgi:hypothetical protein
MDKLKNDLDAKGYFCVHIDNVDNSEISKMNTLIDSLKATKPNNMDKMIKPHKYKMDTICVYLIHKELDKMIGYIVSKKPKTENCVEIIDDDIHPSYRNDGLCELMMKYFILSVNKSIENVTSFEILNAGEEPSFRCYVGAFTDCGYVSYIKENDDTLTPITTEHDNTLTPITTEHDNKTRLDSPDSPDTTPYMYELKFIKKISGGRRKGFGKRKTKKTISSKRKGGNRIRKSMTKKLKM